MSGQANVSEILRALGAASRPGGTLTQSAPPQQMPPLQHRPPSNAYPPSYPPAASPMGATPYPLPQPSYSGSIDLSNIKPVNSGSVSLAPTYDGRPTRATPTRDVDPRSAGRPYQRSRSRSPSPRMTQAFRDNYNPYREERREEYRRLNPVPYGREREFTPDQRGPPPGSRFTPPSGRGFGGPEERPPMDRRMADENNVEVIPIDAGFVGLIIGRQGETMRRVEADTSTRVQFMTGPENSGPMRQCKITGSQHAREAAKAEIYRIIEENGNAVGPSLTGRAPPPPGRDMGIGNGAGVKQAGTGQPALRDNEEAMKIMVPNRTVGLIIGRGGETIRDLQERSACHVNIVGEEKSVNGLRPVNLIGTPSAAAMAKELIMEIVESDTKSLANQGGMPRDTPGISQLRGADGDKINDRIIVPSEAVGMIIGKGGETIKAMQADTGCKINVSPGQEAEREIGLVGSRDAIERAKQAIMEKVHTVQEKNNRSGGGGGVRREAQQFNGPSYPNNQPPTQRHQNMLPNGQSAQSQPQAVGQAGGEDPYAAYGGYEAYAMLWYNYQQQAQQNPQNGPPGS